MIGYLNGTILWFEEQSIVIEVGGIGYRVQIPASTMKRLPPPGNEIEVFTHLISKDDEISLFGFLERESLLIFKVLLEVSGVGPRLALNILSVIPPMDLLEDISKGESLRLQSVHGVGKKTAARICVDLKEKAKRLLMVKKGKMETESSKKEVSMDENILEDALSALLNLGYKPQEARNAISKIALKKGNISLDKMIKEALKVLSKVK